MQGQVHFTHKALRELALLDVEIDQEDVCEVLSSLKAGESAGRVLAEHTGEWMYVFKPALGGLVVYVKLILRNHCILISFHEDFKSDG